MMPAQAWVFRAIPTHVVDGDTLDVTIDQGMHTNRLERLRLLGVNAPEIHGDTRNAGLAAKTFVEQWLAASATQAPGWFLTIQTYKSDVFGRYLAEVWRSDGANLNDDLLASGNAVPYP